jgi:hypothetical protein
MLGPEEVEFFVADSDGGIAGAEDFAVGLDEEGGAAGGAVEGAANHTGDGYILGEGELAPAAGGSGFVGGEGVEAGVAEAEASGGGNPGDAERGGEGIGGGTPAVDGGDVGGDGFAGGDGLGDAVGGGEFELEGLDGVVDEEAKATDEVGEAAAAAFALAGGGEVHEGGVDAHAGGDEEIPAAHALVTGGIEGDFAEGDGAGLRADEEFRGGERVAGHVEVLRDDVAGAKGEDAEGGVGSGEALHDLEDGAVATADEEGVETGGDGIGGLLAGGVGGEGFLEMDVGAVAAEELGDLLDLGAALLIVDEERVEEHHDASHQGRLGGISAEGWKRS